MKQGYTLTTSCVVILMIVCTACGQTTTFKRTNSSSLAKPKSEIRAK